MDAFIIAAAALAEQLMPIFGLAALVFLIIVLRHIISLTKKMEETLHKTETTFHLVDMSLTKIQDPLNTVSKISHGVDSAYDSSAKAVANMKEYVAKNKTMVKEKVNEAVEKVKGLQKVEPVHEPSPEDIIGDRKK